MGVIPVLFIIMLFLIFIGTPIVYSIGIAAFVLASIPFFLFAAELLSRGGLIKKIIDFSS